MSAKVFDELTCPECGGQIGGTLASGVKPCKCFQDQAKPRRQRLPDDPDPVDMAPLAPATAEKPCRICGKDLVGRTRMKDSQGYICKHCSDNEFAVEKEAERDAMQCPECKRKLKPAAFVEYRGSLICKRCRADHEDMDVLKVGKVVLTKHDEEEKKNVKLYVIITAVLILIGLVGTYLSH